MSKETEKIQSKPKTSTGTLLLAKQLKEIQKNPVEGFSAGLVDDSDMFLWDLLVYGPSDTLYEGGLWKATLKFPKGKTFSFNSRLSRFVFFLIFKFKTIHQK
jgi:hypothetical protein